MEEQTKKSGGNGGEVVRFLQKQVLNLSIITFII